MHSFSHLSHPADSALPAAEVSDSVPVQPAALQAFLALLRTPRRKPRVPPWWIRIAHREWGGRCAYCGRGLASFGSGVTDQANMPTVDHLVPLTGGGPHLHDAVVLACQSCKASKGEADWLTWGRAADRKTSQRLRAMRERIGTSETFNHLARDPVTIKTKGGVEKMLAERWSHPRFPVAAAVSTGGTFLAVRHSDNAPPEFAAIALAHHGRWMREGARGYAVVTFERTHDGLAAIWDLIEVNARVMQTDLCPIAQFATPTDDLALAAWIFTSPNVADIVRRRYKTPSNWRPHSEAWRAGLVSKGVTGSWVVRAQSDPCPSRR